MLKYVAILCLSLLTRLSYGLETDNYYAWGVELTDSASEINHFMNGKIAELVQKSQGKNCQQVTDSIGKLFFSRFVHDDPISQHLLNTLNDQEMHPATVDYVAKSIYRDPFRFYIPWFGLAPTIQVKQVHFGMDKLSHFAATGKLYLDIYLRQLRQGASAEAATNAAIDYGVQEERSVYGYWASGVFSFGDLEADFQGMRYYLRFCHDSQNPYLQQSPDGSWKMRILPDISDYISGLWDETYNLSYRIPKNWQKVARVLKEEYCSLAHDPGVVARHQHYQRSVETSYSAQYLQRLQIEQPQRVPTPATTQSFHKLCQ